MNKLCRQAAFLAARRAATLPETKTVAPDATGAPMKQQTTGQAPNVSKKMGAEMDSAGDQRTSPDEQ